MKARILLIALLIYTVMMNAQWNPNGNNNTSGAVIVKNPSNNNSTAAFSWYNNVARIRIGGVGNGTENGFLIPRCW